MNWVLHEYDVRMVTTRRFFWYPITAAAATTTTILLLLLLLLLLLWLLPLSPPLVIMLLCSQDGIVGCWSCACSTTLNKLNTRRILLWGNGSLRCLCFHRTTQRQPCHCSSEQATYPSGIHKYRCVLDQKSCGDSVAYRDRNVSFQVFPSENC